MKTELHLPIAILLLSSALHAVDLPPVILTEEGAKNLGLETVVVEKADFETTAFAFGRTAPIPAKRSVLSSRISGRVIENNLNIGAYVTKGDKLVLLESRQPGDPPPAIWLTAPADGTIISVNASLGAPVEPSDRLAEIADLRSIYLIATMPQALAGSIRQGTQARVRFPLRPDKGYIATLLQYTACPCPDPACALGQDMSTQAANEQQSDLNTAGVVFTMENPDNQLRPGMTAECTIILQKRSGVLSVPREAVQGSPANRHVYVKHKTMAHAFQRVSVQTGLSNKDRIEILSGLADGDEVVTKGSYSLGFAGSSAAPSLKEAMDVAHGHEHNEDGSEKDPANAGEHQHDHAAAADPHDDHATGHDHAHAADADHDHAHAADADHDHGFSTRELVMIGAAAFFAILWLLGLMRRNSSSNSSNA